MASYRIKNGGIEDIKVLKPVNKDPYGSATCEGCNRLLPYEKYDWDTKRKQRDKICRHCMNLRNSGGRRTRR